eukprot:6373611-Amphidinium_carterae.1
MEPMTIAILMSLVARRNGNPDVGAKQRGLTLSDEEKLALRFIVSRACRREVLLTDARVATIAGVLSGTMAHETVTMLNHM